MERRAADPDRGAAAPVTLPLGPGPGRPGASGRRNRAPKSAGDARPSAVRPSGKNKEERGSPPESSGDSPSFDAFWSPPPSSSPCPYKIASSSHVGFSAAEEEEEEEECMGG